MFLDLGRLPLPNALLRPDELGQPEPRHPLRAALCPACSLVQLADSVSPEAMFREYLYFTSISDTALSHARELAESLIRSRGLGSGSLVIELASNDGYLLRNFVAAGIPVLGIEPARNIAAVASKNGIRTIAEFFGRELAPRIKAEFGPADLIVANNVMAHVPDLNGVAAGIRSLLKPGGVFVMETHYALDLIEGLEFESVYHEHFCYYSMTSLDRLLRRHGLQTVSVRRIPVHSGELQVTAVPEDGRSVPEVDSFLARERERGLSSPEFYRDFADRVKSVLAELNSTLRELKAQGKRIAGYGAAGKATTLLNYAGIGSGILDYVVDRSPHKQGLFIPGCRLPVFAPSKLLEDQPDYVLILARNLEAEIRAQQAEYTRRGGRFIVPLPRVRIE